MRTSSTITLPVADMAYNQNREQTMRRTIEQGLEDLRSDVVEIRDYKTKDASLATRRFQFLLMGAVSG